MFEATVIPNLSEWFNRNLPKSFGTEILNIKCFFKYGFAMWTCTNDQCVFQASVSNERAGAVEEMKPTARSLTSNWITDDDLQDVRKNIYCHCNGNFQITGGTILVKELTWTLLCYRPSQCATCHQKSHNNHLIVLFNQNEYDLKIKFFGRICCPLHTVPITHLLSTISTTEPSGLMNPVYSSSVVWLADTPTLWDPSHRNLLHQNKDLIRLCNNGTGEKCHSVWKTSRHSVAIPEVRHAVEVWLLVEDVPLSVHYDRAVHKVFNPVWPTTLVQSQVPVRPPHHMMIQVLPWGKTHTVQDLVCTQKLCTEVCCLLWIHSLDRGLV